MNTPLMASSQCWPVLTRTAAGPSLLARSASFTTSGRFPNTMAIEGSAAVTQRCSHAITLRAASS